MRRHEGTGSEVTQEAAPGVFPRTSHRVLVHTGGRLKRRATEQQLRFQAVERHGIEGTESILASYEVLG
jgi:hypothetical protein